MNISLYHSHVFLPCNLASVKYRNNCCLVVLQFYEKNLPELISALCFIGYSTCSRAAASPLLSELCYLHWRRKLTSRRAGHFMVSVRCGHTSYIRCCLATCKCIVLAVTVSALDVSSVRNFQSCCQRQPPFTFSSPWAAVRQPLSSEAVETSGPMHIPIATKGHENLFVAFAKRKRVDGSTLCSSVGSNTCAPKMEYLVCILAQHSPKKLNEVFSCSPHASWA